MADLPFIKGLNCKFRFFLDSQEVILNAKTVDIKVNVTEIADPVNGEDRDRLDRVTNYFEIDADCYNRNMDILNQYIKNVANDDSQVPPLDAAGSVRMNLYDGSRAGYLFSEFVWDSFNLSIPERAPRVMQKLRFRCRYLKQVKTI